MTHVLSRLSLTIELRLHFLAAHTLSCAFLLKKHQLNVVERDTYTTRSFALLDVVSFCSHCLPSGSFQIFANMAGSPVAPPPDSAFLPIVLDGCYPVTIAVHA